MATLSLRNIDKIYDNNVQAVFDFNLNIKDKEFIVLVGPSGCGKSTTLRMIAGLEDITNGELYIDGKFVNTVMPKDRDIAMVFQNYALYPHMTVYKNMAFGLTIRKHAIPVYYKSKTPIDVPDVNALNRYVLEHESFINHNIVQENTEISKIYQQIDALTEKQDHSISIKEFKYQIKLLKKKRKKKGDYKEEIAALKQKIVDAKALTKENHGSEIKELENKIKEIKKKNLAIRQEATKKFRAGLDEVKKKTVKDFRYEEFTSKELSEHKLTDQEKKQIIPEYDYDAINNLKKQIKKLANEDVNRISEIENLEAILMRLSTNKTVCKVKMVKYTNSEIDQAVKHAADILGLTKYLDRKPAALSGGQRQRVALGRAIVRQPKVFLMDEPLSNLDAKLRVQMRSEIIRIHERVGATTVYVTHDQTEAMTMADRIVIMKDGWVQQIGAPDDVYNDPENVFVGGFIGSPAMNFYYGRYVDGVFYFNGDDKNAKIKLSGQQAQLLKSYNNKEIILGVRPSDIYLKGNAHNHNPSAPIKMTCEIKELLGDEIIVYGDLFNQHTSIKLKAGKDAVNQGDTCEYCFDNSKVYFFDKETTMRIRSSAKALTSDKKDTVAKKVTKKPVKKKK